MKNSILLFILLFTSLSYSQKTANQIIIEINNILNLHSNNAKNEVYLNTIEKIIDINGYQIPLTLANVFYEADNKTINGLKRVGFVTFKCESECITKDKKGYSSFGYSFKSKKGANLLVDLLFQLKKELSIANGNFTLIN